MTDRAGDATPGPPADALTAEQRAIVAWEDGPLVVVAGAGTGKTRVIVERVRRLLESKGRVNGADGDPLRLPPEAASVDRDHPFAGPALRALRLLLARLRAGQGARGSHRLRGHARPHARADRVA